MALLLSTVAPSLWPEVRREPHLKCGSAVRDRKRDTAANKSLSFHSKLKFG